MHKAAQKQKKFANANSYCYYNHQRQRVVVCFFLYQILGDTQRPWKGVIRCMSVSAMMSKTHKLKLRSLLASAAWKDCKIRYLLAHAVAAAFRWCRIWSMSTAKMPSPSMWWQAKTACVALIGIVMMTHKLADVRRWLNCTFKSRAAA